jgi:hypothetical protein
MRLKSVMDCLFPGKALMFASCVAGVLDRGDFEGKITPSKHERHKRGTHDLAVRNLTAVGIEIFRKNRLKMVRRRRASHTSRDCPSTCLGKEVGT